MEIFPKSSSWNLIVSITSLTITRWTPTDDAAVINSSNYHSCDP